MRRLSKLYDYPTVPNERNDWAIRPCNLVARNGGFIFPAGPRFYEPSSFSPKSIWSRFAPFA